MYQRVRAPLRRIAEQLLRPPPRLPDPVHIHLTADTTIDTRTIRDWDGTTIGQLRVEGLVLEGTSDELHRMIRELQAAAHHASEALAPLPRRRQAPGPGPERGSGAHTIAVSALDSDSGEHYDIDTRPGELGMHDGIVTGPLGTVTGDSCGLHQLGTALLAAAKSAEFATDLHVDEAGPVLIEAQKVSLAGQSTAQAIAREGWCNTVLVWANAGDPDLPVEPGDWSGDESGDAAAALIDDVTDLYFTGGCLYARSRCAHERIHRTELAHPTDLAAVRHEADQCPGHDETKDSNR